MQIEPITLEGATIRLVPLALTHHPQLCAVGLDPALWQQTTIRVQTPAEMLRYLQTALDGQAMGTALPFAIMMQATGELVGTTRYHSIVRDHRRLEIGFTWVGRPWQRTPVNTESKYLLLKHAFEHYRCQRVEFKADSQNERSCQALLRIGATREGTLRQYMLSSHRGVRDVALFSIIDTEWLQVKAQLEQRLYSTPSLTSPSPQTSPAPAPYA
jgi:RimJ/RimL family protein N-acetyltransferase